MTCHLETIKLWLKKGDNAKKVPSDELNLVLHEIIAKDIGIRGSDIFTLTYDVVAAILSLIVTFFVICVQQTGAFRD
ncbi:unnamed protein product [Orchesella dallaii]|uniref:Uncharacterized protein n=1 Tax=Orchesella dallaii TaxID=48710 RepID=A0ABP1PP96_9HEXA